MGGEWNWLGGGSSGDLSEGWIPGYNVVSGRRGMNF